MTPEEEEFEFRLRLEKEQGVGPARAEPWSGASQGVPRPIGVAAPPAPPPPPRQVGVLESMLRTVGEAARVAVGQFTMANAGLTRLLAGQGATDRAFALHESTQQSMRDYYAPKPTEQFSTAGQLAGGVLAAPIEIAGGGGLQHGTQRATDVIDRGGSLREASTAGAVTGGARAALNLLPVKAGGAVGRAIESKVGGAVGGALTGGAIATGGGMAARGAENAALPEGEQFRDLRQDVAPSAVEVGLGMALGAVPGAAAAGSAALKSRKAKKAALELPELEGVSKASNAGYWLTPEAAKAGATARGVAIAAGRKSVARHMARHNEENTARLVRQDVGLPEDTPLTPETLAGVRKEAGKAYSVLERYGEFETDPQLKSDIAGITAQARKIAEEFPTLLDSPLLDHAAAVDVPKMTTTGAIAVVRDLRNKADKAMRGEKPDRALASAYRALANAVDGSMERALAQRVAGEGPEAQAAFDAYRAARTQIAKAHLAEDALTGVPGEVDSAAYAKADEKLGGKMTGPGKQVADFHAQFAKQGLAKAPKAPPGEWFHEWRIGALMHAPLTIGGAIAGRMGAQHGLGTDMAQQAITSRARKAVANAPESAPPPPPAGPAPLELAPEGPLPARPAGAAPASPLGDLTPDWETAPGAAVRPALEVAPAEGLVKAVDSPEGPARVLPGGYDPRRVGKWVPGEGGVKKRQFGPAAPAPELPRGVRPVVEDIPAVPGRPDLPDAMVAGGPAEVAATEAVGTAMQAPEAALARSQQEAARLKAKAASPEVQKVFDEHERVLKKRAAAAEADKKRAEAAAEMRRLAAETADPELRDMLHARAKAMEGAELVPAGKAKETEARAKPATDPDKPLPVAEATEVPVEAVEAAPVKPGPIETLDVPASVRPPRTEPRVGKAGPSDKLVPGRVYRDSKGNRAIYRADGTWQELD
jgi:hypothetical protein